MAGLEDGEASTVKRRRKGCDQDSSVDRFGDLPEEILSHILSFLPTKTAVATNFLYKRWKTGGLKLVNVLIFDSRMWPEKTEDETALKFIEFVNMVLLNYSAESIHRLTLDCYLRKSISPYLNIWVSNSIARGVRILDLDVMTEFDLPSAVFSCRTLEKLELRRGFLIRLPLVVSLPKLTALKLISVKHESTDAFRKLISSCPMLQSLVMEREECDDFHVHVISSFTLKHIQISFLNDCDCDKYGDLELKIDTPKLETLILDSDVEVGISIIGPVSYVNRVDLDFETYQYSIVEFLKKFDLLRYLYLSPRTMILLESAPNHLSTCFERVTNLIVDFSAQATQWSCLLDLIDCCTKLEVLELIRVSSHNESWTGPIKVPRCFSSSLKRVLFKEFSGLADEMRMLSHVLQHALLIEVVSVSLGFDEPLSRKKKRNKMRRIQKRVLRLPKASPACEISFSRF